MLDNELVRQKDHIYNLIVEERYEDALVLLDFAADLWAACNYAYKTAELKNIIRNALREKKAVCAHWKVHQKWARLLDSIR